MEFIDIENWNRKEHFQFFYRMDYPHFNICMDIDITNFLTFTKQKKISFYYAMIYAVTKVVNEIDTFKYRIRDGNVVLHNIVHPSFTLMNTKDNNDLFKFVTVDFCDDIVRFDYTTKEVCQNQIDYFGLEKLINRDDLIYITCIPWISFTHISHTINLNKNDSVPRLSWGKYYKKGRKMFLPFSVQVNHALIDGIHIGQFVEKLQKQIDEL